MNRYSAGRLEKNVDLRVPSDIYASVRAHVDDTTDGEEAGFLLCGLSRTQSGPVFLAREWMPVPESEITSRRGKEGYELAWTAQFNALVLAEAERMRAGVVLLHAHAHSRVARLSRDDLLSGSIMFSAFSRALNRPCGTVVLATTAAAGAFWREGEPFSSLRRLRVVGAPVTDLYPEPDENAVIRHRLVRQTAALGSASDNRLADSSVAVIGVSGGGSHVCQQLAHQGFGRIVVIDDQLVEEVQLGRMVGATPNDVGVYHKTAVMRRLIESIDPGILVKEVRERVPAAAALQALSDVDLVVACVDTFDAREQINAYCRRHLLPLIDVGMQIETEGGRLVRAYGQVVAVLPDSACLRCTPLLGDAVLAQERADRPRGYDIGVEGPSEPQVVSMNGVLSSEACNTALDMITGYASGGRGSGWWLYDGKRGALTYASLPPRRMACPTCAQQGHGDGIAA